MPTGLGPISLEDSTIELAEQNENIWAIVGFHPIDTKHSFLDEFDEMEKIIQHPRCVGIGECGLDFYRPEDANNKEKQIQFFEKQIWHNGRRSSVQLHTRPQFRRSIPNHCKSQFELG